MIMRQADIEKVRRSIGHRLGNRVMVRMNKGRHKIDITEGVLKEAYPSIFVIEVNDKVDELPRMLSFSYADILTKDVQMKLC